MTSNQAQTIKSQVTEYWGMLGSEVLDDHVCTPPRLLGNWARWGGRCRCDAITFFLLYFSTIKVHKNHTDYHTVNKSSITEDSFYWKQNVFYGRIDTKQTLYFREKKLYVAYLFWTPTVHCGCHKSTNVYTWNKKDPKMEPGVLVAIFSHVWHRAKFFRA